MAIIKTKTNLLSHPLHVCIVGSKKQKARKEHEINEGKKRTNVNPAFSLIGPSNWTKYTHCTLPKIVVIIIIM